MQFSFNVTTSYLFKEWTTETTTGLLLCSALAGCVALLLEGLKALIAHLDVPNSKSRKCYTFRRSLAALVQLILGYLLMLLIMTYNAWVAISLLAGSVIGYYLFGWTYSFGNLKTNAGMTQGTNSSQKPALAGDNKMNGYYHVPSIEPIDEKEDRETIL